VKLTVDHVIPISMDGSNNIENIQPLCRECNSAKHTQTIDFRLTANRWTNQ
jgi:5-methylcytosine-specific restriction endonuclease McrA